MEIWQIVLVVVIGVLMIVGAGFAIAWPTTRDHLHRREAEEKKEEDVIPLPQSEDRKVEGEPASPSEAPVEPAAKEQPVEHTQREKERIEASKTPEQREAETENAIAVLFGGRANVLSVESRGSRVTISVKDTSLIRSDDFDRAGLKGAMIMSDRIVFVAGSNASEFAANLRSKIGLN